MSEQIPETGVGPGGETADFADRLETLDGKRLVYVDWSKPNGDVLHEVLADLLSEQFDAAELLYFVKPTASSPIPEAMLEDILDADPDGVILAIADCGSCNATVVSDAIEFESAGIPTAQVVTDQFLGLNRQISNSYGYETMPLVSVPHPTRYLSRSEVEELGSAIVGHVAELLTSDEWSTHAVTD